MAPFVRTLQPTDEREIVALMKDWGSFPGFHWPIEALRSELSVAHGRGLWLEGVLGAFVLWREAGDEAQISVLASRKSGLRRRSMRMLLESVFAASQQRWILEVHESNTPALSLYRSLSFREIGRRSAYYQDGGVAIVMARG